MFLKSQESQNIWYLRVTYCQPFSTSSSWHKIRWQEGHKNQAWYTAAVFRLLFWLHCPKIQCFVKSVANSKYCWRKQHHCLPSACCIWYILCRKRPADLSFFSIVFIKYSIWKIWILAHARRLWVHVYCTTALKLTCQNLGPAGIHYYCVLKNRW